MVTSPEPAAETPSCDPAADRPSWIRSRTAARHAERRDAADNRRRILAAARALFAAHGVDAVSMHDIARAAGVGQGTLYRRYAHKGLLCQDLLEDSLGELYRDVTAIVAAGPDAGSALTRLDRVLVRLIAYNEANAPLLAAVWDAACGERRGDCYRSAWYAWLHRTVVTLLRRAADAGETPPLDAEGLAYTILAAACDCNLYLFQRQQLGFSQERIAASVRHLVAGLRAAPASPPGAEGSA